MMETVSKSLRPLILEDLTFHIYFLNFAFVFLTKFLRRGHEPLNCGQDLFPNPSYPR